MSNYLFVSQQKRHLSLFDKLQRSLKGEWNIINKVENFTLESLKAINPRFIFIPHWSHKIPLQITDKYACVMFHMTDLPFGRGGSPLQNLIVRGAKQTKLSAFRCVENLDAGPVYAKLSLSLFGSADEIFKRADNLVSQLIFDIINNNIEPVEQTGEVVTFKRRTPAQGSVSSLENLSDIYDYIRMLDGVGYPNAFLTTEYAKFTFSNAKFDGENIVAKVVIKEKND